jgi:DNA processing protein
LGAIPTLEPTQQLSLFNATQPESLPDLDPICLKVFQVLNQELMGFDSIIELSGLGASEVSGKLLELELLGLVKQLPGMRYQRS